jgi:uncharacterized protein YceK
MKNFFIIIIFLIIAVLVSGCTSHTKYQSGNSGNPVSESSDLQILEHHLTKSQYGNIIVSGTAKNIGPSRLSYGSVEVKFYDSNGNMIGNGIANFNNLDPGETWKFNAMYLGTDVKKVSTYKIGVGPTF